MGTLKAAMIEKADKVYACVDSSKFSTGAFYKVCAADRLDLLVTDAGTPGGRWMNCGPWGCRWCRRRSEAQR